MKCLLCKGKGSFRVWKQSENSSIFDGEENVLTNEKCPRCKGKGEEKYIPHKSVRVKEAVVSYSENYTKYFSTYRPLHHNEILKKL